MYGYFKRHDRTWTWLKKGNLKRETESLLPVTQNNAIWTNYIKTRIDKTQQNCKCWLCGDKIETINNIISECSKLAQKEYKMRYDRVEKAIHWELCKKFKFDHTNKWYMYNSESVQENEMYKHLWEAELQTDHQISSRRPDLVIVKKKKKKKKRKKKKKKKKRTDRIVDFSVLADHRVKLKESEKRNKYQDLARKLKKTYGTRK